MRVGIYLSSMTLPDLEHTKDLLNLTDEQTMIFNLLSRRKTINEISMLLNMSTRTIDREIQRIKFKIEKLQLV